MSESPLDGPPDSVRFLVVVALLIWLLYGLVAIGNALASIFPILVTALLWLLYRLVQAQERIAAAQGRIADAQERRARTGERRVTVGEAPTGEERTD